LLPFRITYSFWLARAGLVRGLGFIYAVAFLILVRQGLPLVGHDGILPAARFVARVTQQLGSRSAGFWQLPSVFWWVDSDAWLSGLAWLGLVGAFLVAGGLGSAPLLGLLWALYLSFVHVGQIFYGYGWDSLLCEAGFLAIFLAPAGRPGELAARAPPPLLVLVLYRWLLFRLMFGAGLIKLRGDACWSDLTCLAYHYETQPNPGPLSPLFHAAPLLVTQLEVLFNHFVELVVPFGLFGPRRVRIAAAALVIVFQTTLILSGNLSFLNWLTIVIAFAGFDDQLLLRLLPAALRARLTERLSLVREAQASRARRITGYALGLVVGALSLNPIVNLLSSRQAMNASFEPFDLVNTYGAFGSVSRERYEVVIEGSDAPVLDAQTPFKAYELPCKPGRIERRPCWVTPYHYRLDWQLWFVPLAPDRQWPWFLSLSHKLLTGDHSVLGLFAENPFPDQPPHFLRASFYRYRFARPNEPGVWHRERVGTYLPPTTRDDPELIASLRSYGLID
jgi:hypothetical protein